MASAGAAGCAGTSLVSPSDPRLAVMGRVDRSHRPRLRMGYPGVTLRLRFEGPALAMRAASTTERSRIAVLVDGGPARILRVSRVESDLVLADHLPPGPHTIEVVHRTETWQGIVTVTGFRLPPGGQLLAPPPWPERRLLFIGDSVTCGEAIDRAPECRKDDPSADAAATSNGHLAFGMVLARALGAQAHLVCYGGRGLVRDWRGKTNVANAPQLFDLAVPADGAAARAGWDHAAYVPDAVVVAVGTNDFNLDLGALPAREGYVSTYAAFVRAIRARYPRAHLFLSEGPIVNDDTDPARPQKTVLRDYIAEAARRLGDGQVHVAPAQRYPGDACNQHPTRAEHEAMARDLEPLVRQALRW
jgi:lysophospholipase L1-like esterase